MNAADLTPAAGAAYSRALTDRIKTALEATWQMVVEAYECRAWASLGYADWDAYCTREFGTSRLRLPREDREEVVSALRTSGMSVRAISSATGASVGTVHATLAGVQNRTPGPHGSEVARAGLEATLLEGEAGIAAAPQLVEDCVPKGEGHVVGRDGKRYSRESPRATVPARVASLSPAQAAFGAARDAWRAAERLSAIRADMPDEWAPEAARISAPLLHDLVDVAIEVLREFAPLAATGSSESHDWWAVGLRGWIEDFEDLGARVAAASCGVSGEGVA